MSLLLFALGEKGRFTVSLLRGGAAERAGVCKGDLLVWMNGATVSDLTHAALSRMVGTQQSHLPFSYSTTTKNLKIWILSQLKNNANDVLR